MSWSLDVSTGDLNLTSSTTGMGTVTGSAKAFQDIKCAILESMGNDPMHPEYGSLLDGGVMPDGTLIESRFGNIIDNALVFEIENEITRVIEDYSKKQQEKMSYEMQRGGKHTFAPGEIVSSIQNIESKKINDTLLVKISILMGNGQIMELVQVA